LLTFICGIGNSSQNQAFYLLNSIPPEAGVEINLAKGPREVIYILTTFICMISLIDYLRQVANLKSIARIVSRPSLHGLVTQSSFLTKVYCSQGHIPFSLLLASHSRSFKGRTLNLDTFCKRPPTDTSKAFQRASKYPIGKKLQGIT